MTKRVSQSSIAQINRMEGFDPKYQEQRSPTYYLGIDLRQSAEEPRDWVAYGVSLPS